MMVLLDTGSVPGFLALFRSGSLFLPYFLFRLGSDVGVSRCFDLTGVLQLF